MFESHSRLSAQSKLSKKAEGPAQTLMSDSSATPERIVSQTINISAIWVAGPAVSGRRVALPGNSPPRTNPETRDSSLMFQFIWVHMGIRSAR